MHRFFQHSRARDNAPLRIGLLIDSTQLPALFAEVVDSIQGSDFAKIIVLIRHDEAPVEATPAPTSPVQKLRKRFGDPKLRATFLTDMYWRWDARNVPAELNPSTSVDCEAKFAGIPLIDVRPIVKGFVHRFPDADLEAVRGYDLDVLIRFGFNILRGGILTAARYGMWSFHHGDNDFYRGGPAHMWELIEGHPFSGVILQILNEKLDDGLVLQKGNFATEPGLSVLRNRLRPYWGSSHFMVQKLKELHESGFESLRANAVPPAPYQGKTKIYRSPENGPMLRWLAPAILKRKTEHATANRVIAVRKGAPQSLGTLNVNEFKILSPGVDPFAGPDGSIFFADAAGRIAVTQLGSGAASKPIIEKPYPLSYPCVFEHQGEWWMIPESRANSTVDLYRAVKYPYEWKLEKTLLREPAVNTTPLFHEGRAYFFTTLSSRRVHAEILFLFTADSLTGDWTLHSTPSTDVRTCRMGGALIARDGKLYRISQGGAPNTGIGWHEILELNERKYCERQISGTPYPRVRIYNASGDLQVIDLQG